MSINQYRNQRYVFMLDIIVTFDEIIEATGNSNKTDANKIKVIDKMIKSRKLAKGDDFTINRALSRNKEINQLSSGERIEIIDEILSELDPTRKRINPKPKATFGTTSNTQKTAAKVSSYDEGSNLGDLGSIGGSIVGAVLGAPFAIAGEIFDSNTLRNIGTGVMNTTANTGEILGNTASGSIDAISGVIRDDEDQKRRGLNQLGNTGKKVGTGVLNTIDMTINNVVDMKDGFVDGDDEKLKKGAKSLLTIGAVGAIGIGIVDAAMDVDTSVEASSDSLQHVDAHYVEGYVRADGTPVDGYWRDGDGDTSVNTNEGYTRGTSK